MYEKQLKDIEQCYRGCGTVSYHKMPRMLEHIRYLIGVVRYLDLENESHLAEVRRLNAEVEKANKAIEMLGGHPLTQEGR